MTINTEQSTNEQQPVQRRSAAGDKLQTVNKETFKSLVLDEAGPVAVEFMSYGCSHCSALEPIIQQVAAMVEHKEKIFRVNVEEDAELASTYEIEGTPTLVMFLGGKKVGRVEGPSATVSSVMTAITHPYRGRQ